MRLKRNEWFYKFACKTVMFYLDFFYRVECQGQENIPKTGPALLLPKHRKNVDILLEGYFLKKYCNRKGNWIMRYGLPDALKYIGGMPVVRPMDIEKLKRNGKIKKAKKLIRKGKENNPKIYDYIEWLYKNGEIVIVHPEGTRVRDEMGKFRREFFIFTEEIEKRYNIKISIIPIGIEYNKNKIYLRAGKARDVGEKDIELIVEQEIKRLSNL